MKFVLLLLVFQSSAGWWIFTKNYFHDKNIRAFKIKASQMGKATGIETLIKGPYGTKYYLTLQNWKALSLHRQYLFWVDISATTTKYVIFWGDWVCPFDAKVFGELYAEWMANPADWVWIPEPRFNCITKEEAKQKSMEYRIKSKKADHQHRKLLRP